MITARSFWLRAVFTFFALSPATFTASVVSDKPYSEKFIGKRIGSHAFGNQENPKLFKLNYSN